MHESAPTLDFARSLGLRDLALTCPACGAAFSVPLSAIELPGDTSLAEIASLRPLPCVECSAPGQVDLDAMGFAR